MNSEKVINRLLELKGQMSENEYASKIGVNQKSLNNWLSGKGKPSSEAIFGAAIYSGVSTDWIYGLSEVKYTNKNGSITGDNAITVSGDNNQNIGANAGSSTNKDFENRIKALEETIYEIVSFNKSHFKLFSEIFEANCEIYNEINKTFTGVVEFLEDLSKTTKRTPKCFNLNLIGYIRNFETFKSIFNNTNKQ